MKRLLQVQRLRAEAVEAAEAMRQAQAANAELVAGQLRLASALQASTAALAGGMHARLVTVMAGEACP